MKTYEVPEMEIVEFEFSDTIAEEYDSGVIFTGNAYAGAGPQLDA